MEASTGCVLIKISKKFVAIGQMENKWANFVALTGLAVLVKYKGDLKIKWHMCFALQNI